MNKFRSFVFCFIATLHLVTAIYPCNDINEYQCGCDCISILQPCGPPTECKFGKTYFCESKEACIETFKPCNGTCLGDLEYFSLEVAGIVTEQCYDPKDVWFCNGEPISKTSVCNSQCHPGYVFVDSNLKCMDSSELGTSFWECGTKRRTNEYNCDGSCESIGRACGDRCPNSNFRLCGPSCLQNPSDYCGAEGFLPCIDGYIDMDPDCKKADEVHKCGEQGYLELYQPCNGTCPKNYRICEPDCTDTSEIGQISPNALCLDSTQPCNGECPEGASLCGKNRCRLPSDPTWTCGDNCNLLSQPCNGTCPPDTTLQNHKCKSNGAENLFGKSQLALVTVIALFVAMLSK